MPDMGFPVREICNENVGASICCSSLAKRWVDELFVIAIDRFF